MTLLLYNHKTNIKTVCVVCTSSVLDILCVLTQVPPHYVITGQILLLAEEGSEHMAPPHTIQTPIPQQLDQRSELKKKETEKHSHVSIPTLHSHSHEVWLGFVDDEDHIQQLEISEMTSNLL